MARTVLAAATLAVALGFGKNVATEKSLKEDVIYPSDHFEYSTQLRSDADLKSAVDSAVKGDHTLFVRWIASKG